jgi:hypothetical protein
MGHQSAAEGSLISPAVPPIVHQSVHGGSPFAPPAQAGSLAGNPAPSVHNIQAAGGIAQQAQPMHVRGADLSYDHIEDFNKRFSDMRVQEVIKATKKHQAVWDEPSKEELEEALKDSLKMYDEHQMTMFARERDQIHAAVLGNLQQGGGGSGKGAGGAATKAKRNSLGSSSKSKDSAGNDPPHISFAPSKHEQSQIPVANSSPDQDAACIVHEEQPSARSVNLERSKSPSRSPSRPRHRNRRRDSEWERRSSGRRGGAERWRHAGMYYSSGAYKGGILDSARPRPKRGDSVP